MPEDVVVIFIDDELPDLPLTNADWVYFWQIHLFENPAYAGFKCRHMHVGLLTEVLDLISRREVIHEVVGTYTNRWMRSLVSHFLREEKLPPRESLGALLAYPPEILHGYIRVGKSFLNR